MKKKQRPKTAQKPKKDEAPVTLGDILGNDLVTQLKNKQKELKEEQERKKQAELERLKEERRLKEKNKSFEELLNESMMNWQDFK